MISRYILLFAILCSSSVLAKEKLFRIAGTVYKPPKNVVVLFKQFDLTQNVQTVLDTIKLDNKNRFDINYNFEPGIYQIDLKGFTKVNFAVEYGQFIGVSVDFRARKKNPEVDVMGSREADLVFQYDLFRKKSFKEMVTPVRKKIAKAKEENDEVKIAEFSAVETKQLQKYSIALADFAARYMKKSVAFFYAVLRLDGDRDINLISEMAEWFAQNRPELRLTKQLSEKALLIKNTALGAPAPEIVVKNSADQQYVLSDFKGKYVLIDFWASWCLPCRTENVNYASIYDEYEDENFTIFSVSFDTNLKLWEQANKKDKIVWPSIIDQDGWQSTALKNYSILSIPANYLIDPQGKIIAKNLRGNLLSKELEDIFD